jgi:hypothetical protein
VLLDLEFVARCVGAEGLLLRDGRADVGAVADEELEPLLDLSHDRCHASLPDAAAIISGAADVVGLHSLTLSHNGLVDMHAEFLGETW